MPPPSSCCALLVSRQQQVCQCVGRVLHDNGVKVRTARDGEMISRILAVSPVDIAILDMGGAREEGLAWCREIRIAGGFPIMMLVGDDEAADGIRALELGADDFVRYPVGHQELLARMVALLRRCQYRAGAPKRAMKNGFAFAGWRLDKESRTLRSDDGQWIVLAPKEFALLVAFCELPSRQFTRAQLVEALQGSCDSVCARNIDVYVHRLRHKLERDARHPKLIRTIRPGGYIFTPKVTPIYQVDA